MTANKTVGMKHSSSGVCVHGIKLSLCLCGVGIFAESCKNFTDSIIKKDAENIKGLKRDPANFARYPGVNVYINAGVESLTNG